MSKQYKPKIYAGNTSVKGIEEDDSFEYLGRWFNYSMDKEKNKKELKETVECTLEKINKLPLYPKNKLWLYNSYLIPKLSWDLAIADIGITGIKQ